MDVLPAVPLFAFNDDAEVKLLHIGRRGIAVTRIDNVLHDPQGVAALGFEQPYVEDPATFTPVYARQSRQAFRSRCARG
jgi:hypothetical protein